MGFSLIGSGKLHFAAVSTLPTNPDLIASYPVKFPECPVKLGVNVDTQDNEEPVLGINAVTRSVVSKSSFEYTLTLKSFDFNILSFLLGGPTPTTNTPPTSIAVGTDMAHTGYALMEWWDNGDVAGSPKFKHHSFSCQIVPDGELSLDPSKFTELTLKVKITAARGTLA